MKNIGEIIYKELQDKEWLEEHYTRKKLSAPCIQRLLNTKSNSTVTEALKRAGIKMRSISEATDCRFEDDVELKDLDVLYGSLLGDCHLCVTNKSNVRKASIVKQNKYKDHLYFFASLVSNDPKIKERFNKLKYKGIIKVYPAWSFRTKASTKLSKIYNEWYAENLNRRKIVPKNIRLTPKMILHWFLDDGCSWYRKDRGAPDVEFCSESFSKEENLYLIKELRNLGLNSWLNKKKLKETIGYRIRLANSSVERFFQLIGPCPIQSLEYKWKSKKNNLKYNQIKI